MASRTRVFLYPLCNVFYDSFYIKGLEDVFGKVAFTLDGFPKLPENTFAVRIVNGDKTTKIAIDSTDEDTYNLEALAWCDVYGKANYNAKSLPLEHQSKILRVGPSFGLRVFGLWRSVAKAVFQYLRFKNSIPNKRHFFANYVRQFKRLPLKAYEPMPSDASYAFLKGSLWKTEPATNAARAAFIEACRNNPRITFEGGFAPRSSGDHLGFGHLTDENRTTFPAYIANTKKSAFVFNTPAVQSCHGWKLAEFLAMGKAIISTRHINELPSELLDGEHCLYVDSLDQINEKINVLLDDAELRSRLEVNAKAYFDTYLAPDMVIRRLLSFSEKIE